jgi:hypothetical protein
MNNLNSKKYLFANQKIIIKACLINYLYKQLLPKLFSFRVLKVQCCTSKTNDEKQIYRRGK